MVPFYAVQVVVDVDLMFSSVDLLVESNIHSKDVSSWVGFMSYTSFAIRQRKWFTEIRKNAEHTGKRENIENPLEQCRRQKIAGLKILMVVSRANNRRLRHFGTQPCPIWPIINILLHTLWEFFENASNILQRTINFVARALKWFRVFWLLFVFPNSCEDNRVHVPSKQTAFTQRPSVSSNS